MYSVYKITGVIITKLRKQETAAVVWKRTLAMKSHQHHFTSDKILVKKWAAMKQKKKSEGTPEGSQQVVKKAHHQRCVLQQLTLP